MNEREQRTANMGFVIVGDRYFADTFVQSGSSVLRMKFSAKTPLLRNLPKRYASCETQRPSKIDFQF